MKNKNSKKQQKPVEQQHKANPVADRLRRDAKRVTDKITKLEAKVGNNLSEADETKLAAAHTEKIDKMRTELGAKIEKMRKALLAKIEKMNASFEKRVAQKRGGAKNADKIEALKFELAQYEKAIAIFEPVEARSNKAAA